MKKAGKILIALLCAAALIFSGMATALAHSGRTDSSGGHNDNKNKSGLGSYHYHCGGYPAHLHVSGYCPYTDVFPSGVTIKADKTTLGIGEKISVSAVVSPSNACSTDVSWECSDSSVIRLSGDTLEAVGYGTATVAATTFNKKVGSVVITVKEVAAQKVTVSGAPASEDPVCIGDVLQLSAAITPENVDDPSVTWASSDENVAQVDSSGKVRALAAGTVTISAAAINGVSDSVTIEIAEITAEKIEIQGSSSVIIGEEVQLSAVFYPADTTVQTVEWSVSDESIAVVDENGKISALQVGEVTVTAVQKDVEAPFVLQIIPRAVEDIEINSSKGTTLYVGDTTELTAAVYPENATYPDITWETSDPEIAVIDENGVLKAKSLGEVVITARSGDGCEETFEISVVSNAGGTILILSGAAAVGAGGLAIMRKKKKKVRK